LDSGFQLDSRTVPPSFLEFFCAKGVPESLIAMAMDIWHGEGDAYKRMMQYKEKARAGGLRRFATQRVEPDFPDVRQAGAAQLVGADARSRAHPWEVLRFDAQGNEEAIDYAALLPYSAMADSPDTCRASGKATCIRTRTRSR